jgi:hypothetical protein
MKVRVSPLLAQFKEALYDAVLESLEPQSGVYGDYIKWHFMVPNAKGEPVSVSGLTSTTFTPQSSPQHPLHRWGMKPTVSSNINRAQCLTCAPQG